MTVDHRLLGIVTVLYLLLVLTHIIYFAWKKEKIVKILWVTIWTVFVMHTIGLIVRWVESYRLGIGHAPLSNFYESLIVYAWCITFILIIMKKKLSNPIVSCCASFIALICMGYASLSPGIEKTITPLVPALQSNWLHIHVLTCFIAYAAFAVSFVAGILYLVGPRWTIPARSSLEELNYKCIVVGFPMLTTGILTGAVWAHYAWGSYWSWDPKETWSLITWIVYALFLHLRLRRGWKGKRAAALSIIGFASVIATYLLVNFILAGLHSYAS